jgi:hypothetical protein
MVLSHFVKMPFFWIGKTERFMEINVAKPFCQFAIFWVSKDTKIYQRLMALSHFVKLPLCLGEQAKKYAFIGNL